MQYYRVRISADGTMVKGGYSLVSGELLTRTELLRRDVPMKCVVPVEVSKREVFRCFGCRFGDTVETLEARAKLYKLGFKDIDSFNDEIYYFSNTGHKDGDHGRYKKRMTGEDHLAYEYCYIAMHTNECEGGKTLLIQFRKPTVIGVDELDGEPLF